MIRTAEDGAALEKRAGFPKLAEVFGKPVAEQVAKWLGYKGGREHGRMVLRIVTRIARLPG
jgi:hypothetical protein